MWGEVKVGNGRWDTSLKPDVPQGVKPVTGRRQRTGYAPSQGLL